MLDYCGGCVFAQCSDTFFKKLAVGRISSISRPWLYKESLKCKVRELRKRTYPSMVKIISLTVFEIALNLFFCRQQKNHKSVVQQTHSRILNDARLTTSRRCLQKSMTFSNFVLGDFHLISFVSYINKDVNQEMKNRSYGFKCWFDFSHLCFISRGAQNNEFNICFDFIFMLLILFYSLYFC